MHGLIRAFLPTHLLSMLQSPLMIIVHYKNVENYKQKGKRCSDVSITIYLDETSLNIKQIALALKDTNLFKI